MCCYSASSVLTKRKLLDLFSYKSRDYRTGVLETIADIPRMTRNIKDKNNTGTTRKERLLTRPAVYVLRNIEARSRNHCCSGKAMSVRYCECVFVA